MEEFIKVALVSDNDGHDYIIPSDKRSDWDDNFMESEDYFDGILPDYAKEVGGATPDFYLPRHMYESGKF